MFNANTIVPGVLEQLLYDRKVAFAGCDNNLAHAFAGNTILSSKFAHSRDTPCAHLRLESIATMVDILM